MNTTKHIDDLKMMAKEAKIKGYSKMKKPELVEALGDRCRTDDDANECRGGVCMLRRPDPTDQQEHMQQHEDEEQHQPSSSCCCICC